MSDAGESERTDSDESRARLVGINHVALEVGDVEEAVEFYEAIFAFELRGRSESAAFLDMGDQFLALMESDVPDDGGDAEDRDVSDVRDDHRHFGLVVDDMDAVTMRLDEVGIEPLQTRGFDFHDPWGNRIQVVAYEEIQFTKADQVLGGMGLSELLKSDSASEELEEKGMAPE